MPCCTWDIPICVRELILDLVYIPRFGVYGADECVVRDVFQVSAESKPRAGRCDMVGCAFALGLDKHQAIVEVFPRPRAERR